MWRPRSILVLSALVAAAFAYDGYRSLFIAETVGAETRIEIEPGDGFRTITARLAAAGVEPPAVYFSLYAQLSGLSRQLQAGEYLVPAGATAAELLDEFRRGNTVKYRFTIVEGWTFKQIIAAMRRRPEIRIETASEIEIAKRLGHGGAVLEGMIYPETYIFAKDESNVRMLEQGYRLMQDKLSELWRRRAADLPYETPYQGLVMASIVEKEAMIDEERARIAGVFTARLRAGMRLQSDPTVIYGLGDEFDGNLRTADLRRDTPYNTYARAGLPPTPIAMPGLPALEAAFAPERAEYLYFVSKKDGSHYFSVDYKEHLRAVRKYMRR